MLPGGSDFMVALIKGTKAPAIELTGLDGKRYNLQMSASSTDLVVLAFFKVGCPTCQFTFPFLERLHKQYPTANIWGVSQDDASATASFAKQYGVTFPILIDEGLAATVKYDLSTVPSIFKINKNLSIEQTLVGFVRAELEELNQSLANAMDHAVVKIFQPGEDIPALKAG
jgi:peroxiredoxin